MRPTRDARNNLGLIFSVLLGFILSSNAGQLTTPELASVQVWATWTESPARITLNWIRDENAVRYYISRKLADAPVWTLLTNVPGSATAWTDGTVQSGVYYEYQIRKDLGLPDYGYSYLNAGIRAPFVEFRGRVILLVEESLAGPLATGLTRLQQDLVGEGWTVLRREVSRNASPVEVKAIIRADYEADPANTKALFLFGHIPVPYSGNIGPDGHDNHRGAWPADVYYGEFDGNWTDTTVNVTNSATQFNWNVPGDGKFDQNNPPGKVRLQIGRVDLSNLTCFANKTPAKSEVDLARQYLAKDHAFRQGELNLPRRAILIDKYGGLEQEPGSTTAFRYFPSFFGPNQTLTIHPATFFPYLNTNACLWGYVSYYGGETSVAQVGTSDDFALNDPKVIFTSFLGSYFGDWDRESNFMRAALGTSTHLLTTFYGGQPPWVLHTMALGGTIGESARMTQNNGPRGMYPPPRNYGVGEVHIALLGDPTLRMHPMKPPVSLSAASEGGGMRVSWSPSQERDVLGYFVYKAPSASGPFTRISGAAPISVTSFLDAAGDSGDFYMVRALKLEVTPAGSYYNLSVGAFYPDPLLHQIPDAPANVIVSQVTPGTIKLDWVERTGLATRFQIERRSLPAGAFQIIGTLEGLQKTFTDHPPGYGQFGYRVKATGPGGDSDYSGMTILNLQTPSAELIKIDDLLGGDWRGSYGEDGYIVMGAATNLPASLSLTTSNAAPYTLTWSTTDPKALMRPDGSSRIFSYWTGWEAFEIQARFGDSQAHRMAFFISEPAGDGFGRVEVIDPFSGNVLATTPFANKGQGNYMVFDVRNYANFRIITGESNSVALVNGVFLSEPSLETPIITPGSGVFPGKATVTMRSTPGATIRYTTDGTTPTAESTPYPGPFILRSDAVLTAKAFKAGYPDSGVRSVSLTNSLESMAVFAGFDSSTKGDWFNAFGQNGNWIAGANNRLPSFVEQSLVGAATYIWSDSATEVRALDDERPTGRMAACWYSNDEIVLDLTLYTEDLRAVALYFLDWDRAGRVVDVTVRDAAGMVVDQRRLDNFAEGKYAVWNMRGTARFHLKRVAGSNVILNGLFVGPHLWLSQSPARLAPAAVSSDGQYRIRVTGEPGQTFEAQYTTDFRVWSVLGRRTLAAPTLDWSFPTPTNNRANFFRAVLVP